MDLGEKLKSRLEASGLSEKERLELAESLDKELESYMDSLENRSGRYLDGWSEENWEEEMENHPFFAGKKSLEENPGQELSPLLKGIQDLKYSVDENTPEELAQNYKEDGNFNFKCRKYRFAVASYTEGLKAKAQDPWINTVLYTNRAAAQFHLGNYKSSLLDCRLALGLTSTHKKAIHRAVNCSLKLKRYQEALDWIDQGIRLDPSDTVCLQLRKEANEGKTQLERDRRKRALAAKKEKKEIRELLDAIQSRGIQIEKNSSSDDLTLEALEPLHPNALHKRVHFNGPNLVWPVLFLYPEYGETDFIEEFEEDQIFADHLMAMFGPGIERPPWDSKDDKYHPEKLRIYFEDRNKQKLIQVDTGKTLKDILSHPSYIVMGGTPSFILLVDQSPFFKEFTKKYKK